MVIAGVGQMSCAYISGCLVFHPHVTARQTMREGRPSRIVPSIGLGFAGLFLLERLPELDEDGRWCLDVDDRDRRLPLSDVGRARDEVNRIHMRERRRPTISIGVGLISEEWRQLGAGARVLRGISKVDLNGKPPSCTHH